MNHLEPIYKNAAGIAYNINNYHTAESIHNNIQLQIGSFALLMNSDEMPDFLKVIKAAKKGCICRDCKSSNDTKILRCETKYASIKIKTTPKLINEIEELVLAVFCNYQVNSILKENNIY